MLKSLILFILFFILLTPLFIFSHVFNISYFVMAFVLLFIFLVMTLGDRIVLLFFNAKYFQMRKRKLEVVKNSDLLMGLKGTVLYISYDIGDHVLLMERPFSSGKIILGHEVLEKLTKRELESLIWMGQRSLKEGVGRIKFYSLIPLVLMMIPELIIKVIYNNFFKSLMDWFNFTKPLSEFFLSLKPHLFIAFLNYPLLEFIFYVGNCVKVTNVEGDKFFDDYSSFTLEKKLSRSGIIGKNSFLKEILRMLSLFEGESSSLLPVLKKTY